MVETTTRQANLLRFSPAVEIGQELALTGSFTHGQSTGDAGPGRGFSSAIRSFWPIAGSSRPRPGTDQRGGGIVWGAGGLLPAASQRCQTTTTTDCVWGTGPVASAAGRQLSAHGVPIHGDLCSASPGDVQPRPTDAKSARGGFAHHDPDTCGSRLGRQWYDDAGRDSRGPFADHEAFGSGRRDGVGDCQARAAYRDAQWPALAPTVSHAKVDGSILLHPREAS